MAPGARALLWMDYAWAAGGDAGVMGDVPTTVHVPEALPAQRRGRDWVVISDGVEVKLTNLDKLYWGPEGHTKADLIAFYWNIAPTILPYLRDRPLTLKRMPDGADGEFFYAKHAWRGTPEWMRTAAIVSHDDGKRIDYLLADDRAALLWLANAGCIELHPWHTRVDDLPRPDYAFFDLDPMGRATFADSARVALLVRTVLDRLGLRGYPRTSGATGVQVYVPVERRQSAGAIVEWVGRVCGLIERADPALATMTWDLSERGDRVFLDHRMNTEGRNIAATYCLRPERQAPVATPLTWEELERGVQPTDFTIRTIWERLAAVGDLFAPVLAGGQDLRAAMRALGMEPESEREAAEAGRHHVAAGPGDLSAYAAKRDFTVTPEPAAGATVSPDQGGRPRFVVQHHLARRLHHDLRLEQGGTARSWALPKGLPEVPGLRHLAVQTEDHPLEYLTFSGRIPEGQYGAGEMRIWDAGTYEPVEWRDGKVTVRLHGRRHTGEYHLFRISSTEDRQWMVTRAEPGAAPPPAPRNFAPMLATAHDRPFDDDGWAFEVKWDGVRVISTTFRPGFGGEGHVRMISRQDNDVTGGYPELADLWERVLAYHAVLDGELVLLGSAGVPNFGLLQTRMHLRGEQAARAAQRTPITYVVFDVLEIDGGSLTDRPLSERLKVLEDLVIPGGRLVRSEPVRGDGRRLYEAVRAQGLEGMIAKRLSSRYQPGRRSADWRKVKVRQEATAVIGGWLPGEGSRAPTLGALLVGMLDARGSLQYAGRVGSGFDDAELTRLSALLADHETDTPPFADLTRLPPEVRRPPARGGARWCRPDLVCDIEYNERTAAGRLRAPVYKGLRPDVDPGAVTHE
ncbi:MAG: ATP-dependent DNA ligase [Nitriliruptorales bacterium]|nr:ATP-dependent DNA ligase [Nitriliruptorales bacterium]